MTPFNMQRTVSQYLESPSSDSSRNSSVSADAAVSNYFVETNTSQADWSHNLALAGIAFGLGENGYADGSVLNAPSDSFDSIAYDDALYSQDLTHIDTHKAARQARRKAQNRAAQRKFRERKDCQLKALEAEISDLRTQIDGSRCTISDLQEALTEAKTQVETLKSILPSIARSSMSAYRSMPAGKQGQKEGNATLSALLGSILQSGADEDVRVGSVPTPKSAYGEDNLYS